MLVRTMYEPKHFGTLWGQEQISAKGMVRWSTARAQWLAARSLAYVLPLVGCSL
jgi:hypothetical protein